MTLRLYATHLPCGCVKSLPRNWGSATCFACNRSFEQINTPDKPKRKRK